VEHLPERGLVMAYKTLTLVVTNKDADGAALAAAQGLARHHDAHLDVFCVGVDPARYEPLPAGSAAIVMETGAAEARARAQDMANWVEGELRNSGLACAVQASVVPNLGLDAMIARLTRYSDLAIAAQPYGQGAGHMQVSALEASLFGTGVPILVIPPTSKANYAAPFERVVIAWNESNEAFAAIRKAVPILAAADRVDVVLVDPPSHSPERSDPGGAICLLLARHGVRAEVSILSRTLPRVSEVIARFAQDRSADLIVMGAYGHSRMREAILGGATRDMLEGAELPLFIAH
jgi:nucleotide-binding universal stress UspA family protein